MTNNQTKLLLKLADAFVTREPNSHVASEVRELMHKVSSEASEHPHRERLPHWAQEALADGNELPE